MTLQTIKSLDGKTEYVLLPVEIFAVLQRPIEKELKRLKKRSKDDDYVVFDPADYIDNPVALARLKHHLRQSELAELLGVSQAYISKVEKQLAVSPQFVSRVKEALKRHRKDSR